MKKKIRKISVLVLIGMLVGMGLVGMIPTAVAVGEPLPYKDDFEDGDDDGWDVVRGVWTVDNKEYYQSNDGNSGPPDFRLDMISVLSTPPTTNDYILQVRMKHEVGHVYYSGIVFRYDTITSDFYLICVGFMYGTYYLELWTCIDEMWDSLAETKVDDGLILTDWNTLTADIRGENFDFYLNGDLVLIVTDSQLTTGTVGLYTEEAKVRFDDWSVGIPVDTITGINVEVDPYSNPPVPTMDPYISLTFDQVDEVGKTTIISSTTNLQPDLSNFYLSKSGVPWVYYHITTTAAYTGDITVDVTYNDAGMTLPEEESINIHHWQGNRWVIITDDGYPDTINNKVVGTVPTAVAGTETLPYNDNFEDGDDDGWTPQAGNWEVHSGKYRQSDTGYFDMVSVLTDTPASPDYIIQAEMKVVDWYRYPYCGLIFRYTDTSNYYTILIDAYYESRIYLEFWIVSSGDWDMLAKVRIDIVPTNWNTMTADIKGDIFDFYINGIHMLDYCDSTFSDGNVGLYTYDAIVCFDDWSVGIPVDTNPGVDVEVDPYSNPPAPNIDPYISLTFDEVKVDGGGETTIISSTTNLQPDLSNFYLSISGIPWVYYHISTTAVYTGDIKVDVTYDDSGMTLPEEESINIHHWQGNQWADVTVDGFPDTTANLVSGVVSSVYHLGTEDPFSTPAGGMGVNLPYYDDFEDGDDDGWNPVGNWEVVGGEYIENMNAYYFPRFSILKTPSQNDYIIQAKIRGDIDPIYWDEWEYGLTFRYQNYNQYYFIALSNIDIELTGGRWGGNKIRLSFWRYSYGYEQYSDVIVQVDPLTWHTFTADIRGNTFKFYLDGKFAFQSKDNSPYYFDWGDVGLYTFHDNNVIYFDDWTCSFPEITSPGTGVEVCPYPDVSVTFSGVPSEGEGETTAIPSAEYPGPDLGNFYIEGVGNFYDISTTAQYDGLITVCLPYDDTGLTEEQELELEIYHWQGNQWVSVPIVSRDIDANKICCEVSSLSWFVVGYLTIEAPEVTITSPASGSIFQVDTPVPFTASFTDTDESDTHTALWEFESGGNIISVPGTVTQNVGGGTIEDEISFTTTGVYTVTLTVTDDYGLQGTATTVEGLPAMVVIYDPSAGFVTGGGWIDSPAGAYRGDEGLIGKASFGFVAKYKKGAQVPTGQTEFKFKVADLNFHSDNYEWLVIAGAKAQFKGTGTINGGDEYNFKLWATDGALLGAGGEDKFRIKIWYEEVDGDGNEIEHIVYDNGMETPLGGGQIVIHKT